MHDLPSNRNLNRTRRLLINDLKVYQQNHKKLKMVNEIIVKASQQTGARYGDKKCVFNRGRIIKAKCLDVLPERMRALDSEQNKNYKFLGCEQAEQIDTDAVYKRVKAKMDQRIKALTSTEPYKRNFIKATNTEVVPVASYVMNICDFHQKQIMTSTNGLSKLSMTKYCMVEKLVMRGSILR